MMSFQVVNLRISRIWRVHVIVPYCSIWIFETCKHEGLLLNYLKEVLCIVEGGELKGGIFEHFFKILNVRSFVPGAEHDSRLGDIFLLSQQTRLQCRTLR